MDKGRNQTGTASALTLGVLLSVAREKGVDVDALQRELDVPPAALHDIEYRIPEAVRLRAWLEIEERTRDPFLGLHVAEHAHIGMFDVLDYAVYFSPTFDKSLDNICRFHRLVCDAWSFRRTADAEVTRIRRVTTTPRHEAERAC
jgi:Arabinose-binding domain of AraC transcription regulator, N-term